MLALQKALLEPPADTDKKYSYGFSKDNYLVHIQEELDYHHAWQRTKGHSILQIDCGFKLEGQGMMAVMSGDGYVLGTWMGTSSYYSLLPFLTALGLRSAAHGQVCQTTFTHMDTFYASNMSAHLFQMPAVQSCRIQCKQKVIPDPSRTCVTVFRCQTADCSQCV